VQIPKFDAKPNPNPSPNPMPIQQLGSELVQMLRTAGTLS